MLKKLLVIATSILASCSVRFAPHESIDIPFRAGVKGTVVEREFYVPADSPYTFYLSFPYKFDGQFDFEKARRLSGGPGRKNGHLYPPGAFAPVKLTVTMSWNGHKTLIDGIFLGDNFIETAFDRVLTSRWLEKGYYIIRAEAIADAPELSNCNTSILVHVSRMPK